ncbi:equilibrative nucleoside transporter 1-like isoform X2 [Paramacrobiotus metropolitanus]|uniref:equilibrative nucleoside transporter 1-like isoform X2 n=1 Tax=Paramacrobiotus metropolitanus TaxID=2943436 RepID=UPI002445E3EA|nr:equilibrative nucleoside transporter 1-like isoform X2 [Paramacrobiotus metropolitanus]
MVRWSDRSAVAPYEMPEVSYYPDSSGRDTSKLRLNGLHSPDGKDGLESPEKSALLPSTEVSTVRIIRSSPADDDELPAKDYEKADLSAPSDRYRLVFLIMLVHGMGVLLPWNVFINASEYFKGYKFGYYCPSLNESFSAVCNDSNPAEVNRFFRNSWSNDMVVAAQMPNLILNALNLFVNIGGGNLTIRIAISIVILIVVLMETCILAIIDSTLWTPTFYVISMASVVVVNMAGGIYQNSLFGVGASLPGRYTNAIITGNNICGTFIALLNIMSQSVFEGRSGWHGFTYFLIALLFMIFVFGTYFILPSLAYYRHFFSRKERSINTPAPERESFKEHIHSLWITFKQVWIQCWNVFFVFFVTLACFPNFGLNIEPQKGGSIFGAYFISIGLFLNFNLFAFVGNLLPSLFIWPGPRWVWIPVLLRALFIPFFIFCNMQNTGGKELYPRKLPVYFMNEWWFFGGQMLLGLTSGYFSSLTMMYAPQQVKDKRLAPKAGQTAAFFLVSGIFFGLLFPRIVDNRL